ncbi:beta-ketoacyl-ACP synthase 3 [Amycolatopsis pithecellobii]|uniref:Beta-ketoacyl-ACP synthase 3 n=1 Tax=Amycolatopsis pithecellobii TaxID=664692 RepID=A0A6N7Z137_9PSEU|nr:beta-ketoacyl-ACP synthase 3 [Amycolatopsis pithecellobii]MTD53340.1 beta-ketoacyl-ACP synthase 3 [Amycolatopsis pithecellobii]
MSPQPSPGARIGGLGHYRPETVLSTEKVAARLGVDPEWIISRTGIRERRVAAPGETVADMAVAAAKDALAGVAATELGIDTVIVATSTAESTIPSTATVVGARLGLDRPAAFDVSVACAGFCCALGVADSLVRVGTSKGVMVIGADKATAWVDPHDRDTAILFGDGAGAAVVLPHGERAIGPVLWGSAGAQAGLIGIDPGTRVLRQDGRAVFRWATGLTPLARQVCDRADVPPDKLAAFVPHQANLRIITALARGLGIDDRRLATDVVDTGNTIAATVPIALSRFDDSGAFSDGDRVLLFGFGAGLAYAGQVVTIHSR